MTPCGIGTINSYTVMAVVSSLTAILGHFRIPPISYSLEFNDCLVIFPASVRPLMVDRRRTSVEMLSVAHSIVPD